MELKFKGQTYLTSNNQVKTVATKHTACYRGQRYQIRVPIMPNTSEEYQLKASMRKYRGIDYIVEHRELPNPPQERQVCYQ